MGLAGHVIILLAGTAVILLTARLVVRACIGVAGRYGLSDSFMGMTILSIGTSFPEIVTHLAASVRIVREPELMNQLSSLAIGTNIGSDVFQQNLLIGVMALLGAVTVSRRELWKNVGGLIAASVALFAFSIGGYVSRLEGGLLAGGYVFYLYALDRRGDGLPSEETRAEADRGLLRNAVETVAGFSIMAVAADRVLDSAIVIAKELSFSYSFFGVLFLGVAAALPELTTSLVSALRKRGNMSAGVLIGSNITNPTFALGAGAMISGYTVPVVVTWYDMPVKIITAALIYALLRKYSTMRKSHALILILAYLGYLLIRQSYFPTDY
jgi:cation:H+ antiporter